jgi:ElaB/YqjD/DUF883 family membrane-anchored ribosome-binding protein
MLDMNANTEAQKDKLMEDLKGVIANAEELLRMPGGEGGEQVQEIRTRVQERIRQAKADLGQLQEITLARAKAAGQATDAFVHENPWQAAGIAAGIGLLLGLLVSRR